MGEIARPGKLRTCGVSPHPEPVRLSRIRGRLVPEHGTAAIAMRLCPLTRQQLVETRATGDAFQGTRLIVEPLQGEEFLLLSKPSFLDRRFEHPDGFVVHPHGHRKRMPVLAAVSEGEARRVAEPEGVP